MIISQFVPESAINSYNVTVASIHFYVALMGLCS